MNMREGRKESFYICEQFRWQCVNYLEIMHNFFGLISTYLVVADMACGLGKIIHIFGRNRVRKISISRVLNPQNLIDGLNRVRKISISRHLFGRCP